MSQPSNACGLPKGNLALVFVTPYDKDTRTVDWATGKYGYGHVAFWGGHFSGSEPMLFDSGIGFGVGFRPASIAAPAPSRLFELSAELSWWMWKRALPQCGLAYDYAGLVRKRRPTERFTCSGLVAHCLPEHMRADLPGRVSPNDIARYFGVPAMR